MLCSDKVVPNVTPAAITNLCKTIQNPSIKAENDNLYALGLDMCFRCLSNTNPLPTLSNSLNASLNSALSNSSRLDPEAILPCCYTLHCGQASTDLTMFPLGSRGVISSIFANIVWGCATIALCTLQIQIRKCFADQISSCQFCTTVGHCHCYCQ